MIKLAALAFAVCLPLVVQAEDTKPIPTYSECFKLLREQVKQDAAAQAAHAKKPLATPADLGADAATRRLNQKLATDDFNLTVEPAAGGVALEFTPLPVDESKPTELTPAEKCKAMYFLTY
jgi:hypothetical protein